MSLEVPMPFCSNCGAQVSEGAAFCGNCGQPAQAAPPPQQQPAPPPVPPASAYAPPPGAYAQPPSAAPPAKKGPNWLLWIGGGIAALILLVVVAVAGAGFFIAKKARDAGFDSSLMQKNPVLGAARMALALNPEVEVVKVDEDSGELTIKEKKTGKVITMRAEDVKNGKISFTDESTGEQMTVGGQSEVQLPDWVPNYPGSKPEGLVASKGGQSNGGLVHFKVSDSPERVVKFYQDALTSAGYKVTTPTASGDGGMVVGEDEANRRTVSAMVGKSGSETDVSVTYGNKQ
jgi:hypothetical protein